MNRHMKKAIQNMAVLKPRPSWNSLPIGAPSTFWVLGSSKLSPAEGV